MDLLTFINLAGYNAFFLILVITVPLILVFVLMPYWMKIARARGWVGNDIHKVDRPEVPESGGVVPTIAVAVGIGLIWIFFAPYFANEAWTLLLVIAIAALIGFIDDRKRLSALLKIGLALIAGLPFYLSSFTHLITLGYPIIPVIGLLQMTIVYPLATPLIIAVSSNTVNMLEGYNGEGAGTCIVVAVAMLLAGIIMNSAIAVIFILPFLAAMAGFLYFNRYPAKVFPGDVGTLMMGAMIGGVAILGGIEVAAFCALLAHVFNSFYVIISVRGLRESHTIKIKDIIVLKDNRIQASVKEGAPITLPRLLLAYGELREPELVKQFWNLSAIAGTFGVVAAVATAWTKDPSIISTGSLLFGIEIGIMVACAVVFALLFWKNQRLRGIATIMILLLLVGLGLVLVMGIYFNVGHPGNVILEYGIPLLIAIPAFALWYFIQNRHFWRTINRFKVNFTPNNAD